MTYLQKQWTFNFEKNFNNFKTMFLRFLLIFKDNKTGKTMQV